MSSKLGREQAAEDLEQVYNDILIESRHAHVQKAASRAAGRVTQGGIKDIYSEIGTTGLKQYGGFVLEEWLVQLTGRRGAWVWREMGDNDPTVGAINYAIRWLARGVDWRVEKGNDPKAAQFVEECMHDMSHTWGDTVSEALSMLQYGWAYHETVYKQRRGEQAHQPLNPDVLRTSSSSQTSENDSHPASSKYKDGRIGWRKLPIRAQETLLNWVFDGYSGIAGMHQIDWHGGNHIIPIEKALLFRTQTTRNNPEGRSILRNAFTSYWALKHIKTLEGIGIERDLAGIPVLTPPDDVNILAAGQANLYAKCKAMVTGVRRDEYGGIVLPSGGWKFELVHSGGSRQIDTDEVVRRYRQDIATSMLADFVLIGQDAVGSFSMVDVKADLFGVALDAILDLFCEVMNRYAIPRLLRLNGMDATDPPQIAHSSAGRINLERVGNFLFQLAGSGAPIPWSVTLLEALFNEAGLPTNFDEAEPAHELPGVKDPTLPEPGEEPVGPGKPPPGEEPFARESHMGKPAPQPAQTDAAAATAPAKPAAATKGGKKAKTGKKGKGKAANPKKPASAGRSTKTRKAARPIGVHPDVHDLEPVTEALAQRHKILADHLDKELQAALTELAEQAASAYLTIANKATRPSVAALHRIVARVLNHLNLRLWVGQRLMPLLRNHAARVATDTQRVIQGEINLEVRAASDAVRQMGENAGRHLGLADIEPQVQAAILDAIRQGLVRGENPVRTAQRIRQLVPAGRFVHAGSRYRSQLIARDKTADLQREAALSAYESNPHITHVRLRDGIYGPPRSDATCMARDGQVVPISQARTVHKLHPLCTLGFEPVVTGVLPEPATPPEREPALVG